MARSVHAWIALVLACPLGARAEAPGPPVRLHEAAPPDDTNDWVELHNGEWLQGKAGALRDRELEFASDAFGVQTLSFEDVRRMYLRRPIILTLPSRERLRGPAELDASGTITVHTQAGPREVPRTDMLSLVSADRRELSHWE